MSIRVMNWAMNDAPVEEPVQVMILVAMAEKANDDGTETYQSAKTISEKARVSARTVQRELKKLEEMGIITRGNQAAVEHFPVNRRPVVYDMNVRLRRYDKLTHQNSGTTEQASDTTPDPSRYDTESTSGTTRMSHNQSLESVLTNQSTNTAPVLFETPDAEAKLHVVKAEKTPAELIAETLYRESRQALSFMGLKAVATYGIKNFPDRDWRDIGTQMRNLHLAGKAITNANLQRALDGIVVPTRPGERPIREAASIGHLRNNQALKEHFQNRQGELTQ